MSLNPEQVAANNNTPIAVLNLSGNSTTLSPGIPITFDGTQSYDPDNTNIIAYNWWYVDGVVKSQGSTADKKMFSYTFTLPAGVNSKTYQIKLTVRDNEYTTASKTITVTVTLSGRTEYYLTDHLGSIRTTIDQNGAVIGFDDYDPFGNVLPGRSSNLGTPNDLNKFTGVERDTEGNLNLDAFGRRLYDSELGRFYGVDRFQHKYPGLNPFQYAANDPVNKFDINGDSVIVLLNSSGAAYQGHQAILIQDSDEDGNLVWFYYSADGPGDGKKDRKDNKEQNNMYSTLDEFANSNDNKKEDGSAKYDQAYMIPTDPAAPETKEARSAANEAVDKSYNFFTSNCSHVVKEALNANNLNDGERASSKNSKSRVNYAPVKKQTAIQRNNPQGSDYTDKIKPKKK